MPWRLIYNPSLNKERGLYPLRARYQGKLDVGFFVAHFSTHLTPNNQPRGPPIHTLLEQTQTDIRKDAFHTSISYIHEL